MSNKIINKNNFSFRKRIWRLICEDYSLDLVTQLKKTRSNNIQLEPPPIKSLKLAQELINQIISAVKNKKHIGIFADYDADGICSAAIWIKCFKKLNISYSVYIPNRSDGYGPSVSGTKSLLNNGADILLFLDCGTNSLELDDLEVPVLILDHHRIQTPVKKPLIVNCHIADTDDYIIFCTAGLSLIMVWHILLEIGMDRSFLSTIADLACIGTIGDVMPITGFNRTIIKSGLQKINGGVCSPVLKALASLFSKGRSVEASIIAFYIVPCINAPGRVANADLALKALLSEDSSEAHRMAMELESINQYRRSLEKKLTDEAINFVDNTKDIIVLKSEKWHPGIVGIMAGKIREIYNKTTFVFYKSDTFWKGSARGQDVAEIIESTIKEGLGYSGGGHSVAGGITVEEGKMEQWIGFVEKIKQYSDHDLAIDGVAHPTQLLSGFGDIAQFGPFGAGNPEPKILIQKLTISNIKVCKDIHLRLLFDNGASAMAFGCANTWGKGFKVGSIYDFVFSVNECSKIKIEDAKFA